VLTFALLGLLGSTSAYAHDRRSAPAVGTSSLPDVPIADAGGSEFHQGPNFVLLANGGALAQAACASQKVANTILFDVAERMHLYTGMDPQIVVVLTTAPLACGDLFYVPFANDVRGIGYQHEEPSELFDDSPESRLEGIAFLNDFPYWQAHPEELAKDFAHEIGHRWSARVYAVRDGAASPVLLGRQSLHWSYYLDSGGSPIEGNTWSALDDGHFRADTPISQRSFSDFDLYLMGVLPSAEVRPERLIVSTAAATDCLGNPLAASSPPQTCGPLDLPGQSESIAINAVIEAEGERMPAADPSLHVVDVAVLVLESDGTALDQAMCGVLTATLRERLDEFQSSTLGRLVLHNLGESSTTCEELASERQTRRAVESCGCQLAARAPRGSLMLLPGLLLLALVARARRHMARVGCLISLPPSPPPAAPRKSSSPPARTPRS
jgi:hypothetical protein